MVILVTGKAGSGKSTYAKRLADELEAVGVSVVVIDGDVYRAKWKNNDYSDDGRWKNLLGAANLARGLEDAGHVVILAFIAPKRMWRDAMRRRWKKSYLVYIPGGTLWQGTEYEMPTDEELCAW